MFLSVLLVKEHNGKGRLCGGWVTLSRSLIDSVVHGCFYTIKNLWIGNFKTSVSLTWNPITFYVTNCSAVFVSLVRLTLLYTRRIFRGYPIQKSL